MKILKNLLPGPPTCRLQKLVCVPELDGLKDADLFKHHSQEMGVKAARKGYKFWPTSI